MPLHHIPEKHPPVDDIWLKASVVGGLWASFEIVIGSFLHNMHIPFSGSILTFFATIFLISFYQMWPHKGLIWRAGLICALMKSISPSAVILGPMTGIMLEALMVDLFIRLIGNNPAGILAAGMASQLSALLHKIGSMLILYGFNILKVYENVFDFVVLQFRNLDLTAIQAVTCIFLIYASLGVLASMAGYYIGKRSVKRFASQPFDKDVLLKEKSWETLAPGQSFHLVLLILNILVLPIFLFFFNARGLHPVVLGAFILYSIFCLVWYRNIKFRLLKPIFWMHLLIIGILAGFFWTAPETSAESSGLDGWIMGLSLILRAVLVLIGFSALSVELRNPLMKAFFLKIGSRQLYQSVSMAFSALPLMMERGVSGRAFLTNPIRAICRMLSDANHWLYVLQQNNRQEP